MKTLKLQLRSIRKRFSELLTRLVKRQKVKVVTVPISHCRHYCAFKYGCRSFNPYENYIIGLHENVSLVELRRRFEDFLTHFRPSNFGEVFGIELSRYIPLWVYPWQHGQSFDPQNGWLSDLDQVPDIVTHFCEQGIKRSRIEEEYSWLERAYSTILRQGYRPQEFSYIEAFELNNGNQSVFIITDGNHRISALSALGQQEVIVKLHRHGQVSSKAYRTWPQVRFGTYSEQDAIDLVNVYFAGVDGFKRSSQAAIILAE